MSTNTPTKVSAAKAYVGAAIAAVVAGLGALVTALEDGAVTGQESAVIALAVFVSLGGVFGGVWATTNKPVR
ncbi:membrane protein [Microbacterium phage Shocker]|uniref:Membrane protein n=1 Tax=Microbacterium phage Shocker TaxID=2805839 RepID=A0A890UQQ7_9CAUD|nr:membrane protein [Microbacterium phage Shocker]QRI45069.1 membrane protein [Microbacterium phage Shocker]